MNSGWEITLYSLAESSISLSIELCRLTTIKHSKTDLAKWGDTAGFLIEDTADQTQVNSFLGNIHSNNRYEVIAIEVEKTPINFSMFTDPKTINTIH